ncbi:DUF3185 family protein [Neptunicella sp.]|uniref:DUF3185 family protein n=1 Tax=Neptunicella sp. TaxID=2125986 RepID=UPI003F6926E2
MKNIISLVLLVLGVGLIYWGWDIDNSVQSEITQTLSGSRSDKVMTLYIGGAVSLIVGLYLYFKR